MPGLKKRQKDILIALKRIGGGIDGTATVRQIASRLELDVNGVSQSLGAPSMAEYVEDTGQGKTGDRAWRLKKEPPGSPTLFRL